MGERHGDGGASDRRVAGPAGEEPVRGTPGPGLPGSGMSGSGVPAWGLPGSEMSALGASGPDVLGPDVTALEALLAAAIRGRADDVDAEARAVAAFRAARDGGRHAARSRRRDDWRPRERQRLGRSLKATLAVLLASLTLGGVAVAAIGSSSDDDNGDDQGRTQPSNSAPDRSAQESDGPEEPGSSSPGAAASAHPSQAEDTEAHCRAYEAVKGRGKALNSTAWQQLVGEAGGEDKVAVFCAEQLAQDAGAAPTGKADSVPSAASTARATPSSTSNPRKSKGKP